VPLTPSVAVYDIFILQKPTFSCDFAIP